MYIIGTILAALREAFIKDAGNRYGVKQSLLSFFHVFEIILITCLCASSTDVLMFFTVAINVGSIMSILILILQLILALLMINEP